MKDRYKESGLVRATLREGQGVYVILVDVPPFHFKLIGVPYQSQVKTTISATKDAHVVRNANLSPEQVERIEEYIRQGRPVDQKFYDELGPKRPSALGVH